MGTKPAMVTWEVGVAAVVVLRPLEEAVILVLEFVEDDNNESLE